VVEPARAADRGGRAPAPRDRLERSSTGREPDGERCRGSAARRARRSPRSRRAGRLPFGPTPRCRVAASQTRGPCGVGGVCVRPCRSRASRTPVRGGPSRARALGAPCRAPLAERPRARLSGPHTTLRRALRPKTALPLRRALVGGAPIAPQSPGTRVGARPRANASRRAAGPEPPTQRGRGPLAPRALHPRLARSTDGALYDNTFSPGDLVPIQTYDIVTDPSLLAGTTYDFSTQSKDGNGPLGSRGMMPSISGTGSRIDTM